VIRDVVPVLPIVALGLQMVNSAVLGLPVPGIRVVRVRLGQETVARQDHREMVAPPVQPLPVPCS
jgi:hypothetical protein